MSDFGVTAASVRHKSAESSVIAVYLAPNGSAAPTGPIVTARLFDPEIVYNRDNEDGSRTDLYGLNTWHEDLTPFYNALADGTRSFMLRKADHVQVSSQYGDKADLFIPRHPDGSLGETWQAYIEDPNGAATGNGTLVAIVPTDLERSFMNTLISSSSGGVVAYQGLPFAMLGPEFGSPCTVQCAPQAKSILLPIDPSVNTGDSIKLVTFSQYVDLRSEDPARSFEGRADWWVSKDSVLQGPSNESPSRRSRFVHWFRSGDRNR